MAASHHHDKDKIEIKDSFQAVLLADTYVQTMSPIDLEVPSCLLPVANIPAVEYTIALLQANKINEVIIVYTSHKEAIEQYFNLREKSQIKITLIHSPTAKTVGDAMRDIQYRGVVYGDFVLLYGDLISNVKLTSAIKHFLLKKKEESLNIMTTVLRNSSPFDSGKSVTEDDFAFIIHNGDILQIEKMTGQDEFNINLDRIKLSKGSAFGYQIRYNLQDTEIYICSMDVLAAFKENFTLNSFREDFINEMLTAEIKEEKINAYILSESEYTIRSSDFRLYYKANQAVIQNNISPFTLQKMQSLLKQNATPVDFNISISKNAQIDSTATIGNNSCIGENSTVGQNTKVIQSVVGKNCQIGNSVKIIRSIVQDNVVIEEGSLIDNSLLCTRSTVKAHSQIQAGSVISFNVIVPANSVLPPQTLVNKKRINQDKQLIQTNNLMVG